MFYPVSMSFVEMWSLKAITSNENSEASFAFCFCFCCSQQHFPYSIFPHLFGYPKLRNLTCTRPGPSSDARDNFFVFISGNHGKKTAVILVKCSGVVLIDFIFKELNHFVRVRRGLYVIRFFNHAINRLETSPKEMMGLLKKGLRLAILCFPLF